MRAILLRLAVLVFFLAASVQGEDKDKRRLFNTFFLDGNRVTYVLTLRQADRSYEIIAPDGQVVRGNYSASDKEIGFPYQGGQRHFEYDFDGKDVKLKPTKKDQPRAGTVMGSLPPIGADSRAVFIAIQNWEERGLPTQPNRPAGTTVVTETPPVAPPIPPVAPVAQPVVGVPPSVSPARPAPKSITGTYAWTDAEGRAATLRLREGGTFDYTSPPPERRSAGGTYLYLNGELNLDSGFWRRHFRVAEVENGISFSRRETDVPRLGDPLGEMSPSQGTVVWAKVADTTAVSVAGPITPVAPLPTEPIAPLNPPVTQPVIAPPSVQTGTPTVLPKPDAEPARPDSATQLVKPSGLAQLAGTYTHRPNPLVNETWMLTEDGRFEYRDSNGAKVAGTATLNGGVLRLQAGEVVRQFSVGIDDAGSLTLNRMPEDAPRILNDLASMSPSVLKSARYQKQ